MNIPFVDLHAQYLTIKPEIDAAIADVIRTSAFIRGPHVQKFEEEFAAANCVNESVALVEKWMAAKEDTVAA